MVVVKIASWSSKGIIMSNADAQPTGPAFAPPTTPSGPVNGHVGAAQFIGNSFSSPSSAPSSAASASLTKTLSKRSNLRGRTAGLLAAAVLSGALGGGASVWGYSQLTGASSTSTTTRTEIVQASGTTTDWATVAKTATQAVVSINVSGSDGSSSRGSGVVIDSAGHVVTNNHVISSSGTGAEISVTLGNSSYRATVVGTDPTTDLAVIKLVDPPAQLQVMGFADSDSLVVGQEVMAIGNPLGLDDTVTTGIISALNRPVTTEAVSPGQGSSRYQQPTATSQAVVTAAIQTNAAINPGNSGGALVDSSGQLVGITSSIASLSDSSSSSGNIGLGFAIPAKQVKYVTDQLIASGTVQHAQIGISAQDQKSTGALGAEVTQVTSGSPAEKAGVQVGDLVTAVDGNATPSTESLVAMVRAGEVGKPITLTVLRNGKEISIDVTPEQASR